MAIALCLVEDLGNCNCNLMTPFLGKKGIGDDNVRGRVGYQGVVHAIVWRREIGYDFLFVNKGLKQSFSLWISR